MTVCDLPNECAEIPQLKLSWLAFQFQRAYWNGLEFCLSEMPWVPEHVLEVGCGNANLLADVGRFYRWASLDAIEVDTDLIESAKVTHPCRVRYHQIAETEPFSIDSGAMDLILCHGFLSAIGNPEHYIDEIIRVSSGCVFISLYHPAYLAVSRLFSKKAFDINGRSLLSLPKTNIGKLTSNDLKSKFAASGFKLLAQTEVFPCQQFVFQKQ